MKFQHLFYFITVIDCSTFTAAAKQLHISQPSLSTAIKKLESDLGLVLLDRTKKDLTLTKEGKILYQEAKRLLIHFNYVEDEMKRLKDQGPLELSIGVIESAKFWVSKVLAEFKENYADVFIQLFEVASLNEVEEALSNFEIHLAITNQYINTDNIESVPLYDEQLIALLPPAHPLKDKDFITISDLENEKFIISQEGFQTRVDMLTAFRKAGVKPNIQFEIGRFETACSLVEEGLGITVAPENYVKYMTNTSFHPKPIQDSNISRTVYLAVDNNRYLPPLVHSFISLVRGTASKLPDGTHLP